MCQSAAYMSDKTISREKAPVDVDAIIADIRKNIKSVEPKAEALADQTSMYDDLEVMCNTFSGGHWPSGGIVGLFRKVIYRMLGLKEFNGRNVSVLTKIISVINGTDVPESSVILTNQRRTINMLVKLSNRLDQYDNESIVERLSALEKQAGQKQASEKK